MPKQWITPFAYVEDEALHLCCDRVCEETGLPLTEENLRLVQENLTDLMRQLHPGMPILSNVEQHLLENRDRIVSPEAVCAAAGLPASAENLEIAERELMRKKGHKP
jgi:hypothetical protein